MTDLTKRLRALSRHEHDDLSIGDEAADEIEQLRGPCPSIPAMRDAANEVGRLRAALAQSIGTVRELMVERDALRARIEDAPTAIAHAEHYGGSQIFGPGDLDGKRVALVVLEDEK